MHVKLSSVTRVVLLGGGVLLLRFVQCLVASNTPVCVISSRRHENEILDGESLGQHLKNLNVDCLITDDLETCIVKEFLGNLEEAFCLSLSAPWIFNLTVIEDLFQNRLFNFHGTRLPQNRGGGGYSWQIMMGNRLGFCQLHMIDSGVDTGEIVKFKEYLYPAWCRIPRDYIELSLEHNIAFLEEFVSNAVRNGIDLVTTRQPEYLSTYWPRLNTEMHGWIDWSFSIDELERVICAFDDPYMGCKTLLDNKVVCVKGVLADFSDPKFHPFQYGIIYRKSEDWISICANGGTLIVTKLIDADGENILRNVRVGDRFFTPDAKLEVRAKRINYNPRGDVIT